MEQLSRNEIMTLRHLSDGNQHSNGPAALTPAQFATALKLLQDKGLAMGAFVEGGLAEGSMITPAGQALMDDISADEHRIQMKIVMDNDLTPDQFVYLRHGVETGKCKNNLGMDESEYIYHITKPLFKKQLIRHENRINSWYLTPTRLGTQLVNYIEESICIELSKLNHEVPAVTQTPPPPATVTQELKDSGFRIRNGRVRDVIKVVDAMYKLGIFVDVNGNQPTEKSIMDALATVLANKNLNTYSAARHKALLYGKKRTYLSIFEDMLDYAEKDYKEHKHK